MIDPEDIAKQIISVQPMGEDVQEAFASLLEKSLTEKELLDNGYRPVSKLGLMYIKDKSENL